MTKTIYATKDQIDLWETALRLMQDEVDDRHLSMSATLHECVRRYVASRTEPVDRGDIK